MKMYVKVLKYGDKRFLPDHMQQRYYRWRGLPGPRGDNLPGAESEGMETTNWEAFPNEPGNLKQ